MDYHYSRRQAPAKAYGSFVMSVDTNSKPPRGKEKVVLVYASKSGDALINASQHHAKVSGSGFVQLDPLKIKTKYLVSGQLSLTQLNLYLGYYFVTRSGNWHLRKSCLKIILPLFFVY